MLSTLSYIYADTHDEAPLRTIPVALVVDVVLLA